MNIDTFPVVDEDDDLHNLSSNRCKPLSIRVIQEVTSQVLSYYKGSPEHANIAAGAMIIKIRDLIVTKGQSGDDVSVTGGGDKAFREIIDLHNPAFTHYVNQFTPSGTLSQMIVTPLLTDATLECAPTQIEKTC